MIRLTFITGFLSILLGAVLAFLAMQNQKNPVTALVPAYVGVIFVGLGAVAFNLNLRKHVMHLLAGLSLLLLLGTLGMAVPKLIRYYTNTLPEGAPERLLAWWGQLGLAVLMGIFLVGAVRSFVAARRARGAATTVRT
jgi:hypothetical protein